MSILNFFGKVKKDIVILADLGSYSLKTAVFEISRGTPKIAFVKKRTFYLPHSLVIGSGYEFKAALSRLREAIFKFIRELRRIPSKVIVGLGNSMVESAVEDFSLRRAEPSRRITKDELKSLFNSAIQDKIKSLSGRSSAIIGFEPLKMFINGYEVRNFPENLKGEEVNFKVFLFIADSSRLEEINSVSRMFGGVPVEFSSIAFSLAKSVVDKLGVRDAFIVDIGGLYTNLILVRDGIINDVKSISMGGNDFSKALGLELGLSMKEAGALARQYSGGIATNSEKNKIHNIFAKEAAIWGEKFMETLDLFDQTDFFPGQVYFLGGGANIPEIAYFLESKQWLLRVPFAKDIAVSKLTAENLAGMFGFGPVLKGVDEVGLVSLLAQI